MKTCVIIAPNDRYNYGDLLFSHILREKIGEYYDTVINVATIDSDLSQFGGHKVHSIKKIKDLVGNNNFDVILAGGHSLFCQWPFVLFCLGHKYEWLSKLNVLFSKALGSAKANRIVNNLSRFVFGASTKYPYSIGKFEIKGIHKLIYNCIDGNFDECLDITDKKILKSVDHLSIRNKTTHTKLKGLGIDSFVAPDSAIQISQIFPIQTIIDRASINPEYFKSSYIVFQVNRGLEEQHISAICCNLAKITKEHNIKIYLCPIGFAKGHEDLMALNKIYECMANDKIRLFEKLNIWDIMCLIANSQGFIGTSLHGCITAMSYCRPYIGLDVTKTLDYIRDWGLGNDFCASCNDFFNKYINLKNCPQKLLDGNFQDQLKKSEDNFRNLRECLNLNSF